MTLSEAPKEVAGHGLLEGKVVVVTAAAGTGIGSATARRALAEGADVVISDHHERRLGETADQLSALGQGRVESVVCDVTSTAQVDALIASTTARMGRIDVLVNNAGLGGQTPVADMTDEEWDRVLDVTVTSVFRATRAALRYFRDADHGGVIVNNASVLGWPAQRVTGARRDDVRRAWVTRNDCARHRRRRRHLVGQSVSPLFLQGGDDRRGVAQLFGPALRPLSRNRRYRAEPVGAAQGAVHGVVRRD